ncbi:MAG TPA: polysaccharide biosynthesis tyrosine autokinase [Opitutaceae bacterium]|nr:polysaccharide biosynthesis tyrosine autokinase [Opitutaceae bacterium]
MAELSASKHSARSSEEEDDVVQRRTFRDYYIILRERLWIALPLAVLVAVSVGYMQARVPAMYAASATLQFDKPPTIVTTQGVMDATVHNEFDINTYIQDMQSAKVRNQVVNSFSPEEQAILMRPRMKALKPGQPPPTFGAWDLGNLIVTSRRQSFIVDVTVQHQDGEAAAIVANKYIEKFMEYLMSNNTDTNDFASNFLHTQAEKLRADSEDAEKARAKYLKDRGLVSLDASLDSVGDALKAVQANLTAAKLDLLNLNNTFEQIKAYQAAHRDMYEIAWISQHGNIPGLRAQLSDLQRQKATLAQTYLERHPKMLDVNQKIATVQAQLAAELAQAVADFQTELANARNKVDALSVAEKEKEKEEMALEGMRVEYNSLVTQAQVAKSNYMAILDRMNQTDTSRNLDKVPLRPLDPAVPSTSPYQPDIHKIVKTCVGLGVIVFIGVAMGLSFVDDRIKSAWDVEAFIGVNLLGIIPDLSSMKGEDKHSLVLNHQQTPGVEAFLGVYSAVKIQSKLDYPKSILITSTIPGEGKTLVSSNLAGGFARHGKKTILIDCDLRRPMLHRHFKQQNNVGLIPWFENGASLEGTLATNPHLGVTKLTENFSLLTSGGRSKSPTSMLEQPVFGQFLEKLKKEYDVVVVDSPPMGAVTDALLIAERTDEVIYVCRFNRAYRKHIKLYIRALLSSKNAVLGIVLNGLSPRRIEYYSNYRYYRSYKKYYGSQT